MSDKKKEQTQDEMIAEVLMLLSSAKDDDGNPLYTGGNIIRPGQSIEESERIEFQHTDEDQPN